DRPPHGGAGAFLREGSSGGGGSQGELTGSSGRPSGKQVTADQRADHRVVPLIPGAVVVGEQEPVLLAGAVVREVQTRVVRGEAVEDFGRERGIADEEVEFGEAE